MPEDWIKMNVKISIPEIHISLLWKGSTVERPDPIIELVLMGLQTKVKLGQDFTIVDFSYKKFNIDSVGQSSIFNYMLETVFPGDHSKKNLNALDMHLEMNPWL